MSNEMYQLPTVAFGSDLVRRAFALERLRADLGRGSTPPALLASLHNLFQILMSVVSARIEGNRTTVYDALKGVSGDADSEPDSIREIRNILEAMTFIDSLDARGPFTHALVRELHRISVKGLVREGDPNPGQYRAVDVQISKANHVPPSHVYVHSQMSELLDFVNRDVETSEQMIHAAMAHHRFLWVHPFRNGNGRVSRLLSYAMLRKHGFESVSGLRTVNPTSVFGNDRDGYYSSLAAADDLTNEGTVAWCTFFVTGLHDDLARLIQLQNFEFVLDQLIGPALDRLQASGAASRAERQAMEITVRKEVVKAGELSTALPGTPAQRSLAIRSMLERGLLEQDEQGPRFYRVPILGHQLGPLIVRQLDSLGFLPKILKEDQFG